ncbi:MAG: plastocyanin/azurin family copper-binding protein [Chloroflexus sp.]|nr:plastocyanin/azurin family copper-binding protein [Chloroflexus sp.]
MNAIIERKKMIRITRILRTLIVLGLLLGLLLGTLVLQNAFAATERSAGNAQVTIANFAYSPSQVTVRVGNSVTWTNNDSAPHTVTANDASFNSGTLGQGGVYSHTFNTTGVFSYFCAIHPSMTGNVRVISETLVYVPLVLKGQEASAPIVGVGGRWSNPATWGGQLSGPNSEVIIPAGRMAVLDVSATVRNITLLGDLVWDDRDGLELQANWIMVHGPGSFRIGAEGQPFTKRAAVTLTGNVSNENVMGMGTKFLAGSVACSICNTMR